jgi:hypothetical protein
MFKPYYYDTWTKWCITIRARSIRERRWFLAVSKMMHDNSRALNQRTAVVPCCQQNDAWRFALNQRTAVVPRCQQNDALQSRSIRERRWFLAVRLLWRFFIYSVYLLLRLPTSVFIYSAWLVRHLPINCRTHLYASKTSAFVLRRKRNILTKDSQWTIKYKNVNKGVATIYLRETYLSIETTSLALPDDVLEVVVALPA